MIVPPWLQIAYQELGVKEIPGAGDNPRIVEYHHSTTLRATDDEVPWCSSFVSWCVYEAQIEPTHSARARSWLRWGVPVSFMPPFGAICVFNRGGPHDPAVINAPGHVGFLISEAGPDKMLILGGNQGNAVSYREYKRDDLLGVRWPQQEGD
jgi:uncharacterized protein (TIGR02594 family)